MPRFYLPLLLLLTLSLAACDSVVSVHPIGQPVVLENNEDDPMLTGLNGIWGVEDSVIFVKTLPDGRVHAATLEWNNELGRHTRQSFEGQVTKDDGVYYINILNKPNAEQSPGDKPSDRQEEPQRYGFVRYTFNDHGQLVIRPANARYFAEQVEASAIAGSVKRGEHTVAVTLTADPAALAAFIDPEKADEQFPNNEPVVLTRMEPRGDKPAQ